MLAKFLCSKIASLRFLLGCPEKLKCSIITLCLLCPDVWLVTINSFVQILDCLTQNPEVHCWQTMGTSPDVCFVLTFIEALLWAPTTSGSSSPNVLYAIMLVNCLPCSLSLCYSTVFPSPLLSLCNVFVNSEMNLVQKNH